MPDAAPVDRRAAVDAWEALHRAQIAVQRDLRQAFPDEGVSQTEYDVLLNLSRAPGARLRIRDLHRHLLISQPSVSRLIERMERRGMVSRCADADDARGTVVELTPGGRDLFRRVGTRFARRISERVGERLTDDEARELLRLSEKLRGGAEPRPAQDATALPDRPPA